jgi:hypothetical protein
VQSVSHPQVIAICASTPSFLDNTRRGVRAGGTSRQQRVNVTSSARQLLVTDFSQRILRLAIFIDLPLDNLDN